MLGIFFAGLRTMIEQQEAGQAAPSGAEGSLPGAR
jgi:hypothetical protein